MLLLLLCPDLRAVDAEHKRTLAATEELGDGTRTFNYGPIFKLAHQHQSGSYLEELHDLRLCHPPWIKPFITRWHFCPVLNACTPWESDAASETWRVMDNPLLCKGWQSVCCGGRGGWGAPGCDFPAMPTASPGRCLRLSAASCPRSPSQPPSPEVADSLEKRNHPRQMGPLTLAGPSKHCVLVTCHLLLFCGWNTSRQKPFSCGWDTKKKGRGWGKADIASLRSSSKFSERAGIKRRTRLRANKSRAPPLTHTKKGCCAPLWFPSPLFSL